MAAFQVVVGDPDTSHTYQFEIDEQNATRFLGKQIGETVDGAAVGFDGYTLEITGGSDAAGRPMHAEIGGAALREVLVDTPTTGYKPSRGGERRRITVRGREISDENAQVNTKIVERGDQSIEELLGETDPEDEAQTEADDEDD